MTHCPRCGSPVTLIETGWFEKKTKLMSTHFDGDKLCRYSQCPVPPEGVFY